MRRGLTILEVGVAIIAIMIIFVLATMLFSPGFFRGPHSVTTQYRDTTQIREIHRAMIVWAQNNRDEYPLPSKVDVANTTVAEEGRAKDTTANIMSMMLFNGSITPDILVSPAEVNRSIRVYRNYEYDRPRRAVRPADALWDPGLRADFTGEGGGHISYAHLLPTEERLARWGQTYVWTEPVVGNRGPEITGVTRRADGTLTPRFANARSNTFRIHGSTTSWAGNIAFNDNNVLFLTRVYIEHGTKYTNTAGEEITDLLFYDEPDDPSGLNHFLGIFIKAGEKRSEFRGIWD
jgi:hypothetical protein